MYVLRGSAKRAPHFGNGNRHPKFYWRNHRWSRFHRCRANSYFSHHTSSTPGEKRPSCDDLWASFGGGARRAPPFWRKLNTIKKFLNHLSFGLVVRQMAKFPYTRAWSSTTLPVTDYCRPVMHRKRDGWPKWVWVADAPLWHNVLLGVRNGRGRMLKWVAEDDKLWMVWQME